MLGNFLSGALGGIAANPEGFKKGIGKIGASMTDDKGLFQGGSRGGMFGRLKDKISGTDYQKGAENFAQKFNPQDTDQVMALQQKLNKAGANLKQDGMLGPKTLGALRAVQGGGAPTESFSPMHLPQGMQQGGPNVAAMPEQAPEPSWLSKMGGAIGGMFGGPDPSQQQGPVMGPQQAPQQAGPWAPQVKQDPFGFGAQADSAGMWSKPWRR